MTTTAGATISTRKGGNSLKGAATITSLDLWSKQLETRCGTLYQEVKKLNLTSYYDQLVALMLYPVYPTDQAGLERLTTILMSVRYGGSLAKRFDELFAGQTFNLNLKDCIQQHLNSRVLSSEEAQSLDWLLLATRTLTIAATRWPKKANLIKHLQDELRSPTRKSSGVRVEAEMISAGQNLGFAGRDVNIVTTYYSGSRSNLLAYLARVTSEWDHPELGSIVPTQNQAIGTVRLHKLYTPVDVWDTPDYADMDFEALTKKRFKAIEEYEIDEARRPVIEAIAASPYIVITGGPGTGKTALSRYIATCLAYACNPEAQDEGLIDGLTQLGPAWVHGAILPIYVKLRNFSAMKAIFPKTPDTANAQSLLDYLRKELGDFGSELESYLINKDVPTHGTLLILDGLDEVYHEQDRLILQRIIENWADRFSSCRIIVTSRTYAYRADAKWHLSQRFKSAELAPYTWQQMQIYIENWYSQAALRRPFAFDGVTSAKSQTALLAKDLTQRIIKTTSLWTLARQPLMLAMLTLIHEANRKLPDNRAHLYQETVALLDRWNSPVPHVRLENLNLRQARNALRLVAYRLQTLQEQDKRFPMSITRKDLLHALDTQQKIGVGLGAAIEDVLEYLSTRNGIVVSDKLGLYRFPHLSIQEFLAANALIDLFDECDMPTELTPPSSDGWYFPENIAALLRHEPFRWRNVTLFAGSILAAETGQTRRWQLIEALLPPDVTQPIPEEYHITIIVAAEIWSESYLKARMRSEMWIKQRLLQCLKAVQHEDTLDAPERANTFRIIGELETL